MPTDQQFPSFRALNGRDAVEFVDFDSEKPMSQDDQDFINGTGIYTDTPKTPLRAFTKSNPPPLCVGGNGPVCGLSPIMQKIWAPLGTLSGSLAGWSRM